MTRWARVIVETGLAASLIVATPIAATLLLGWRAWHPPDPGWRERALRSRWLHAALLGGAALTLASLAADGFGSTAAAAAGMTVVFLLAGVVITRSGATAVAPELGHAFAVAAVITATTAALTSVAIVLAGGGRVAAWSAHPNLWGAHLAAGLGVAIGLLMRRHRVAAFATGLLGVAAVAATGSRTAALAMVVASLFAMGVGDPKRTTGRRHRSILVAAMLLLFVASIAVSVTPLGLRLLAIGGQLRGAPPTNRLLASEELTSALWTSRDVTVERLADEEGVALHRLQATTPDGLARLHQRVFFPARATILMSVEFGPAGDDAGLLAFGEPSGRLSIRRDGTVLTRPPDLDVSSVSVEELGGGWTRLSVTVDSLVEHERIWRIGLAPSLASGKLDAVRVRRPSIVLGNAPLPYEATTVRDREAALAMNSAAQRVQYVPVALTIAARSWLFGHGRAATFAELADEHAPGRLSDANRPPHAHSLLLDLLVTHGVLGVIGFGLMAAAWWMAVPRSRRILAAPLMAALVVSNLGDATLFTGGPEYALLAFLLLHAGAPTEA